MSPSLEKIKAVGRRKTIGGKRISQAYLNSKIYYNDVHEQRIDKNH